MLQLLAFTLLGVVLGGGAWIVPLIGLIGAFLFGRIAYKAHNSEWRQVDTTGKWHRLSDKTPYKAIPQFWGAVICVVAIGVFFLVQYLEK